MKRVQRLRMKKTVACALAFFAMLALQTTTPAKLATNKLGPFSAAANSAAANKLAASAVASHQPAPNRYAANPTTTRDFIATPQGGPGERS